LLRIFSSRTTIGIILFNDFDGCLKRRGWNIPVSYIDKGGESAIFIISPPGGYKGVIKIKKAHKHQHQDTKKIIDRMSRAIGHMESIKRMVEEDRDCSEILIQLSAVRSAINNVGKIVLQDHINNCVVDAVETGDKKVLEDLENAIDKFLK
jgi:DNA-binding FrmR family transcriptional regulator